MGAWIEIIRISPPLLNFHVALFMGAWIEIFKSCCVLLLISVALFMGAWIELARRITFGSLSSYLLELLPDVSIVCSSGQFTFAIWQLLRKLVRTDTQLYYCGDLDPEGLAMAQKLKSAFGDQIQWICMDLNHFNLAKTTTKLSENRFKQLRMITDPALSKIAEAIQVEEKVAYQEGFLSHLIDEVEWLFWHDQR